MILYFDNYIDDKPLTIHSVKANKNIRQDNSIYRMPRKLDIAKYTLASYKVFPWSKVIIKFDVANENDREPFMKYARELFPDAEIILHRSDNQKKYQETVEKICKLDDEWIFYTPNCDHPIIANDITHIYRLLEKAKEYKKKYRFVSVVYSMFSEYMNVERCWKDTRIIEEDNDSIVFIKIGGDYNSCQIVHRDLLRHWFCSQDMGNALVRRAEDVQWFVKTHHQLVIAPKQEICAHFDGYSHTMGFPTQISPDQVPPLFIPDGFFENKIRIAYGYTEYRDGWVNINPNAKHYSFRKKKNGTDLKIGLDDIPLFWRSRIEKIDVNPNADLRLLKEKRDEYFEVLCNPWKDLKYRIYIKIKSSLYISYLYLQRFIGKKLNTIKVIRMYYVENNP